MDSAPKKGISEKFQNLSQTQKLILASVLTILVIGTLLFGNYLISNWQKTSSIEDNKNPNQNTQTQEAFNRLSQNVENLNPEELVTEEVSLENLEVYPSSWVEKHFNATERRNALISGPDADPDRDGLSNKQEYIYSSDPKETFTLCESEEKNIQNCGKNDKEKVEEGISPLTGLEIIDLGKVRITRLDKALAEEMNLAFNNASSEGIDFPEIYQLSQTVDLSDELQTVEVNLVDDTRNSILKYSEARALTLRDFAQNDTLLSFTEIYKLASLDSLEVLKNKYQDMQEAYLNLVVPKSQEGFHRVTLLSLEKSLKLIDYRISSIESGEAQTDIAIEKGKTLAIELVWTFRKMIEEEQKLQTVEIDLKE